MLKFEDSKLIQPKMKLGLSTYKQLNNYYFDEDYKNLKEYLRNDVAPISFDRIEKARFYHKYGKDFKIINKEIVYEPLDLIVANPDKKEEILKELYDDFTVGVGVGLESFYKKVRMKYLNLTREETKEFLKNQSYYQLTKQQIKTTNKPIVVSYPNERWSADLIDMNQYASSNSNNKFILTVIDNFSKYVFAVPLKNKEAQTVTDGFERIVNQQAYNTYPSSIQTDNGTEFAGEFIDWCKANKIFIKKSLSYSPTSNSLVENFNNILRKMIREGFVRTNSFNWINYLEQYLVNRNNTPHSLTKHPPSHIWKPSRDRIIGDDIIDEVKETIKSNARTKMKLNQVETFESGEKVRVLLSSLFPKIRKLIKSNLQKLIPVKYSPNVYTIEKIKKPIGEKKDLMKPRYTLSYQGNLITSNGKTQTFYGSELQRVDKISPDEILTQRDAMKLNLLKNEELFDENDQLDEQEVDRIKNPLHYEKKIEPDIEKPKPEPEIVPLRKSTRTIKPRNILDL